MNVFFPSEAVTVEGALADYASKAESGNQMHRHFCAACGTPVFTQSEARRQYIGVRAGTLDDPELGKPQMAIWTSSPPSAFDPTIPREPKQPRPPAQAERVMR
ncbi:MAG: GFA family protein, partial [Methyloceanibacter sp.]